jgi:hypothetical protein
MALKYQIFDIMKLTFRNFSVVMEGLAVDIYSKLKIISSSIQFKRKGVSIKFFLALNL